DGLAHRYLAVAGDDDLAALTQRQDRRAVPEAVVGGSGHRADVRRKAARSSAPGVEPLSRTAGEGGARREAMGGWGSVRRRITSTACAPGHGTRYRSGRTHRAARSPRTHRARN